MKIKKLLAYLLLLAICIGAVACTADPEVGTESSSEIESSQIEQDSNEPDPTESDQVESTPEESSEDESDHEDEKIESTSDAKKEDSEESEESEESETEDPRLSLECAPSVYFDAKGIYELTKDGVYEDMPQYFQGYDEVTYHKEEGQRPYTRLLSWNDYGTVKEAIISLCTAPMEVAPYFAVKYRTTIPGLSMEIYTDSVNSSVNVNNVVRLPVSSDGEWHVEYVNLSSIKQFNGEKVNYFRFDFMNSNTLPVDAYIDFEYFGFFDSEEDVEMFETGKYVPVVYVDPNSSYKECTTIIHASSIDMINGAGGAGATTFSYRGGNSAMGIDKFNHNGTTLSGGKLVFSGWTVVDGGIEKFVWSIDGLTWYDATFHQAGGFGNLGAPHIAAAEKYTGEKIIDVANAVIGGGYQGTVSDANPEDRAKGLACELLKAANVGDVVNVRFAAVPKKAPDELCLIAYVKNVEIVAEFNYEEETEDVEIIEPTVDPEDCKEHTPSIYWYPTEGELKENKLCTLCGSAIESRDVAFYSSFDIIEYDGGKMSGGYGANKMFEKDGSSIVLRSGYDFVVQGWFACNGGVKDYMYSVDGGETWLVCGNSDKLVDKFRPEHISAIEGAKLDIAKYDVKGMYRLNLPLKQFATDTDTKVDVLFGACPSNNPEVVIVLANIKDVKLPAVSEETPDPSPDTTVKFDKSIDYLYIGSSTINNPAGNVSGQLFTYDASATEISETKTVKWTGWAATDGGFAKWAYSLDDGVTWTDFTSGYAVITRPDVINHLTNNLGYTGAAKNGDLNLTVDLSAFGGQTVSVLFGGYAASDPETVIPMVKIINIKVNQVCGHVGESWESIEGQHKETFNCDNCGLTLTRDITFVVCSDKVEYSGGVRGWKATAVTDKAYVISDVASMPVIADKGLTLQGWVCMNGGISGYKWSVDGETWFDAGTGYYSNTGIPGAVDGYKTGITNYTSQCQYNINLSGLCSLEAGTYTVYLGAIPSNNTGIVVPIIQIENVVVQ